MYKITRAFVRSLANKKYDMFEQFRVIKYLYDNEGISEKQYFMLIRWINLNYGNM